MDGIFLRIIGLFNLKLEIHFWKCNIAVHIVLPNLMNGFVGFVISSKLFWQIISVKFKIRDFETTLTLV